MFLISISNYFQITGSLITAIICLYRFNFREYPIKVLGVYSLLSVVFSLILTFYWEFFYKISPNFVGDAFTLIETTSFSLLFFFAIDDNVYKRIITISLSIYLLFYLTLLSFFEENAYSLIRFGRDFLLIFYAIGYFYYLLLKLPEENLLRLPMFWINAAIIFFFSGTLILSFMRDYLVHVLKNDMSGFWAFRNFFRFVFCFALSYAGWLDYRSLSKSTT